VRSCGASTIPYRKPGGLASKTKRIGFQRIELEEWVSGLHGDIVQLTGGVTELHVDFKVYRELPWLPETLDVTVIMDMVCPLRNRLQHLKISYLAESDAPKSPAWSDMQDFREAHAGHNPHFMLGYFSLRHLPLIRTLEAPFKILLGCTTDGALDLGMVLPPALERLQLCEDERPPINTGGWCGKDVVKVIMDFVEGEKWRQTHPHLKIIKLAMTGYTAPEDPMPIEGTDFFSDMFKTAKLKCGVIQFPGKWWRCFDECRQGLVDGQNGYVKYCCGRG
jgi:hypothetical protein